MNSPLPSRFRVVGAAANREWLSHRLNRFAYAHLALVLLAGLLPLLTPADALARGAAWWLLHAVLYALSLSSLLLGLSSAQAEADEFVLLLGQPRGLGPWLTGKAVALLLLVGITSSLLIAPVALAGAFSPSLLLVATGAAGISTVGAMIGLCAGFWIRDSIRGLITVVACWFGLLFGTDLLLLGVAGAPWVQQHPDLWVATLMLNPLDAFRVTVLFEVEQAAFAGLRIHGLAQWWIGHASFWLGTLLVVWTAALGGLAWLGARRRLDN